MSVTSHARYSAWLGGTGVTGIEPGHVLEALSDAALASGIDAAVSRALHQGLDSEHAGELPGLDALKDNLRAAQRNAIEQLRDAVTDDGLAAASALTSDDELKRLLAALGNASPMFAGALAGASDGQRAELEGLLQAGTPGTEKAVLREKLDELLNLALLDHSLRSVRAVQDVAEIDRELLRQLLGEDAANRFERLVASLAGFEESGFVVRTGSRATLSARAIQHIGDALVQATMSRLQARSQGDHRRDHPAQSHETTGTSRDYRFGDPFDLDIAGSLLNAVKRHPGTPLRFNADDLRIVERESSERATTILAVDLSRSMGERGYLLVAKKLALALSTWIQRRFPHDELKLIGFSESARPLELQALVELQWDRYGFGTNVHDALRVSNGLLASHRGRKRNLVLITDGEPTAHRDASGEVVFNHPPSQETLARTYREAIRLRTEGIYLCVCLLSDSTQVGNFGRELARRAGGDVVVTDPDDLSAELILRYGTRSR